MYKRALKRAASAPNPPKERELDASCVSEALGMPCEKDSFEVMEDIRDDLGKGVSWRRRRLAWTDAETGEDLGLCVNTIHVSKEGSTCLKPSVAMANPGLLDFDAIERAYWATHWASTEVRASEGQRASRLFVNMRVLTCAKSNAPRGPWEDLNALEQRVYEGQLDEDLLDLIPVMNPRLRRFGDSELDVVRYLPAHPPSWTVQADPAVLAATNGGYFLNFPEEYEDGLSALHQPLGALYADDQLHMPPWLERPAAIEWADGVRRIEMLGPENIILTVNDHAPFALSLGIRSPHSLATVWRSFDGPLPKVGADDFSVDLVFSGSGLARLASPEEGVTPPIGGAIVRLSGELAAPWRSFLGAPRNSPFPKWRLDLQTTRSSPLEWVMAAGPKLVIDGRALRADEILLPIAAGDFGPGGPPPTRFPYDTDYTRAPRTALGITADEEWVIVVVDGRSDMLHSTGLTLHELGILMRRLGCFHAINLDGGGSSVMAVEGLNQLDQLQPGLASGVVNIPSDDGGAERIVPVVLTVYNPALSADLL